LRPQLGAEPTIVLPGLSVKPLTAAVSHDGRYLAIAASDWILYIWDLVEPGPAVKCIGHDATCQALAFSADNDTLVSHAIGDADRDATVRFWHVATGAELLKIGSANLTVHGMDLNPAGTRLAIGVESGGQYGLQLHHLQPNGTKRARRNSTRPRDQ
jgi:WD40 repeat protein